MKRRTFIFINLILLCTLFLSSCETKICVKATKDGKAEFNFKVQLGTILTETIETLALEFETESTDVFDQEKINDFLIQSDLKKTEVLVEDKTSLYLNAEIPAIENQKMVTESGSYKISDFIYCSSNELSLKINPDVFQEIVLSMPEETQYYLDLLMAPVLTNEKISTEEYIDLVATIYGEPLAAEVKVSTVKVELSCPDGMFIKNTKTNKKEFNIPLAQFLCTSEPKEYSIQW